MAKPSFLDRLFPQRKSRQDEQMTVQIIEDRTPIFQHFGKNIYYSDIVNNGIERIAKEVSKIQVASVVASPKDNVEHIQQDDITTLFATKPNPLQTTSDFLSTIEWLRRKESNVYIYPQYEEIKVKNKTFRRYLSFYPLYPTDVKIGTDETGSMWLIKFLFPSGEYILPYEDIIHLKWRRGVNPYFGGNDLGKTDTHEAQQTLESLTKINKGVPKALEASLGVKGMLIAKGTINQDRLSKERDTFEDHIMQSKSGIVATSLAGEFVPVNIKMPDIPKEVQNFLKASLSERYGVSLAILSGDYTAQQHDAFYQTAIEDLIVEMEQAFSHCLFTPEERLKGHKIAIYYNKARYFSTEDKIKIAEMAVQVGNLTLDEINNMFGFAPFEGGGRRVQSLNFVNQDIIDQYQLGRIKPPKGDKGEKEE